MVSKLQAELALFAVSIIWGLTFPLIRKTVETLNAFEFVTLRFGIALLLLIPFLLIKRVRFVQIQACFRWGLILGFVNWISYSSQTMGLETTTSARAAFITGLAVIMVPFLSPLFGTGRPRRLDFISAFLALLGLYLLVDIGTTGLKGLNKGDLWVLLCAFSYAISIHLLQLALRRSYAELALVFHQIFWLSSLSLLMEQWNPARGAIPWDQVVTWPILTSLIFCGFFATIGTIWLQTRYQGLCTPERAALIYSMEPVFAALFGYWILNEQLSLQGWAGCGLILFSLMLQPLLKLAIRTVPNARLFPNTEK